MCIRDRYDAIADEHAGKGGEASSKKSGAGLLETHPGTQYPYLHHLSSRLYTGLPLFTDTENGQVLHGSERTVGITMIILMK